MPGGKRVAKARRQPPLALVEPITGDMPAGELLTRLSSLPDNEVMREAGQWLECRGSREAAQQLLQTAADASPPERVIAVGIVRQLGEAAGAAWRGVVHVPNLAAHARAALATAEHGLAVSDDDVSWLVAG